MQDNSNRPPERNTVARAELTDLDLETVAAGMNKLGSVASLGNGLPVTGFLRTFPMMSFPSLKMPNFFGS